MKVYVFGNPEVYGDDNAPIFLSLLRKDFKAVDFVYVQPNEDLPFTEEESVNIIDAVSGISKVDFYPEADLDKVKLPPRTTTHDFDLGFQLRYLKKLGKLGKINIIGIPLKGKADYSSIHSMVKKLVAQDMQGS